MSPRWRAIAPESWWRMPGPLRARTSRPRVRSLMTGDPPIEWAAEVPHAEERTVAPRVPAAGPPQGVGLPVGGGGDTARRGRAGSRPYDLPLPRPDQPGLGRGRHLSAGGAARRGDARHRPRPGGGIARSRTRPGRCRAGPARLAAV